MVNHGEPSHSRTVSPRAPAVTWILHGNVLNMKAACAVIHFVFLGAAALAQTQSASVPDVALEAGKAIDRSLSGAETHSYRIQTHEPNLYCSLIVDQRGIDVVVSVFAADGKKLAEVDNFNGTTGPERLNLVLEQPAVYRAEVRSFSKNMRGQYGILLAALRPVTTTDLTRITADRAFDEAELLRTASSVQVQGKAAAKYREAIKGYASIEDLESESDVRHLKSRSFVRH